MYCTAEKNLNFFLSKIAIYLSLGLHKGRSCYRRSLALKNLNFLHFCESFGPPGSESGSVFAMRIRILPTKMNADPCGSGSATLPTGYLKVSSYWQVGNYYHRSATNNASMFQICNVSIRIRIRGSVPLDNGSGYESGTFRQWLSRSEQKSQMP